MKCAALCALDGGCLEFVAAAHEGAGMGFAIDGKALPHSVLSTWIEAEETCGLRLSRKSASSLA